MASQEDYLDQLLRNLTEEQENDIPVVPDEDMDAVDIDALLQSAIDSHDTTTVEDTANMSEDAIARLLEASQNGDSLDEVDVEPVGESDTLMQEDALTSLLNESNDADLMEIQDLLEKADNNEEIIEETEENSVPQADNKAEEKKLQNEAKKEAKRAAKDARKAEKEAKKAEKAAKKAEKKSKKKQSEVAQVAEGEEGTLGIEELLAGAEDVSVSEPQSVESSGNTDAEDALLKELEAFDFLNDVSMVDDNLLGAADSASADSLAQVMENGKDEKTKKGLFARFRDFINEEDEEESENENIMLSDENQTILKDMDKEKKKGKKAKKGKKGKAAGNAEENIEELGAEGKGKKAKKPKKEKKPKEEKQQTAESTPVARGKKIPTKQIAMVAVVCASIVIAILFFVQFVGDYSVKQEGKKAFYEGDYQTCYQDLFGKDLNETEQVMYSKSESILTIRLWLKEYELLAEEGQEVKALDSLLQSVYDYPTLYTYAETWNAETEVASVYNQMLTILSEKYHLTEAQAKEIANTPDDIEYTRMVIAITDGEAYGSWNQGGVSEEPQEVLENPLQEELELNDTEFVDNHNTQ